MNNLVKIGTVLLIVAAVVAGVFIEVKRLQEEHEEGEEV